MAPHELSPIRRVVTGEDSSGRSRIEDDRRLPGSSVPERPGYRSTNIWVTKDTPTRIDAPDFAPAQRGVKPPTGGTVLRIIDYPPEPADPAERRRQLAASFAAMFPDADHRIDDKHPGMHRTLTVDYAIVLEGEMVAVLDEGETILRAGDVLIQRGTSHAWANRSGQPARVCFVLIDAKR